MEKTIDFGKVDYFGSGRKVNRVTVDIGLSNYPNKPVFTASVWIWNLISSDIVCGGQMLDKLKPFFPENKLLNSIIELWERHHLNDLNAGTPEQMAHVKGLRYDKACAKLKELGLYEVEVDGKPYKYGNSWLYKPIPADDLQRILDLF